MEQQIISHQPHAVPGGTDRRVDLDWVRIAAFGLLILYHVGMLYVSWGFHIKSEHRITALEPLMLVLNPWRLALLFLVSGAATRFMLRKYAIGPLLRSRSIRLMIPLIFGMLVIVPPQAYEQIVESLGYPAGFLDFYTRHYFAFGAQFCNPGPCILLPTWNHLWFVAYLWVYTMALGVVLVGIAKACRLGRAEAGARAVGPAASDPCRRLRSRRIACFCCRAFLPRMRCSATGTIMRCSRPSSCSAFCWRAPMPSGTRSSSGAGWRCRSRPGCSCICSCGDGPAPPPHRRRPPFTAASPTAAYQWSCIVAVLGFARRWLTADTAVRRYLTEAIFPYYIVHQTAIIMIAHQLHGRGLPAWLEAAIVISGTFATCVLTYEIVRRIAVLRPLFGLRSAAVEPTLPARPITQPALDLPHAEKC